MKEFAPEHFSISESLDRFRENKQPREQMGDQEEIPSDNSDVEKEITLENPESVAEVVRQVEDEILDSLEEDPEWDYSIFPETRQYQCLQAVIASAEDILETLAADEEVSESALQKLQSDVDLAMASVGEELAKSEPRVLRSDERVDVKAVEAEHHPLAAESIESETMQLYGMQLPQAHTEHNIGVASFREGVKFAMRRDKDFATHPEKKVLVEQVLKVVGYVPEGGLTDEDMEKLRELVGRINSFSEATAGTQSDSAVDASVQSSEQLRQLDIETRLKVLNSLDQQLDQLLATLYQLHPGEEGIKESAAATAHVTKLWQIKSEVTRFKAGATGSSTEAVKSFVREQQEGLREIGQYIESNIQQAEIEPTEDDLVIPKVSRGDLHVESIDSEGSVLVSGESPVTSYDVAYDNWDTKYSQDNAPKTESEAMHAAWDDVEESAPQPVTTNTETSEGATPEVAAASASAPSYEEEHNAELDVYESSRNVEEFEAKNIAPTKEERQTQKLIQMEVSNIEQKTVSWLDTFDSYKSPYEALAQIPFKQLQAWKKEDYDSRKARLEAEDVKFETMNAWFTRFAEMQELVPEAESMTFKEVVDAYVLALQGRYW